MSDKFFQFILSTFLFERQIAKGLPDKCHQLPLFDYSEVERNKYEKILLTHFKNYRSDRDANQLYQDKVIPMRLQTRAWTKKSVKRDTALSLERTMIIVTKKTTTVATESNYHDRCSLSSWE